MFDQIMERLDFPTEAREFLTDCARKIPIEELRKAETLFLARTDEEYAEILNEIPKSLGGAAKAWICF